MSAISERSKGAVKQAKTLARRAAITSPGVLSGASAMARMPGRTRRASSANATSSSSGRVGARQDDVVADPSQPTKGHQVAEDHVDRVALEQRRALERLPHARVG